MTEIKFPVYVLAKDCGDVDEYSSAGKLTGYLEAIDVENGEYEAWDSAGRRIKLVASGITRMNPGGVSLEATSEMIPVEVLE